MPFVRVVADVKSHLEGLFYTEAMELKAFRRRPQETEEVLFKRLSARVVTLKEL